MTQNKILYIVEADLKTGAGKCAAELIQRIHEDSEYEPIVITQTANDINDFCSTIRVENYHVNYARTCSLDMKRLGRLFFFLIRPLLNFISYQQLKKKIDFSQVRLLHSNAISIDFGAYLHKTMHIPHIWHVRDSLIFEKKWHSIIWNLPLYANKNSSKIITVSNRLRDYLIQKGCDVNKTITIHDGIEIPLKEKTNNITHPPKKVLNVACIGLICDMKGQEVLIDAIIKIPIEKRAYFRFNFWGAIDPKIKDHIMNKVSGNNLSHIVSFNGFSTDVFSDLENMDIGIQPSHSEGLSRVTSEYMAAGLCVIASRESNSELIQNQKNGFLYDDYDDQSLANHLIYCYENQNVMIEYAKQAQKDAWEKFNFEKNFKKIESAYKDVCHEQQ